MTIAKSVRNNQFAQVLEQNETGVVLKMSNGEEKNIARLTFKRWWKIQNMDELTEEELQTIKEQFGESKSLLDETNTQEAQNVPVAQEILTEQVDNDADKVNEKKDEPKADTEKKETKKRGRKKISGEHPLKAVIENWALAHGSTIFQGQVTGFRSVKLDGRMYMAFNFNTKGVTLQLRSKAVEGLVEYRHLKHMFDARVTLTENNAETVALIDKLMQASYDYQQKKNSTNK